MVAEQGHATGATDQGTGRSPSPHDQDLPVAEVAVVAVAVRSSSPAHRATTPAGQGAPG
jgi:hypothetical protein